MIALPRPEAQFERPIEIEPAEILYHFDGPAIFTARIGIADYLFYKVDEDSDSEQFVAAVTDGSIITLVKQGKISVRGALNQGVNFVFNLNRDFMVQSYCAIPFDQLPDSFLPPRTLALFSNMRPAFDHIEQARSFLAIRFEGAKLSREGTLFSVFKNLVDSSYDAAKKLLMPQQLTPFKTSIFDMPVIMAPFSSLTLSLGHPILKTELLSQKLGHQVDTKTLVESFYERKNSLFANLSEAVRLADEGKLSNTFAKENFAVLDNVKNIVPTERNELTSVEFTSSTSTIDHVDRLIISERAGNAFEHARKIAEKYEVVERGTVMIVNAKSKTFVFLSDRAREVTCTLPPNDFDAIARNDSFKSGARISVQGNLKRRTNRDLIMATDMPTITSRAT